MGIKLFGSSSDARYCRASCDAVPSTAPPVPSGNPDPAKFEVIDTLGIGDYLIVEIRYPDCKNYEGRKIMVYKGTDWESLKKQKLIDPHFSDHPKFRSPIARFEPTDSGWRMAEIFVKAMVERKK